MNTTTYDLTIGDLHTYYVDAGDTAVLVHNDSLPESCAIGSPQDQSFPNFRNTKTAAKSGSRDYLSGWSKRKSKSFTQVDPADVGATRAAMGMPDAPHGLDLGVPGRYNNSHAEKQAIQDNPGAPVWVTREMCPDCLEYFTWLAYDSQMTHVVSDPVGVNVFYPTGDYGFYAH